VATGRVAEVRQVGRHAARANAWFEANARFGANAPCCALAWLGLAACFARAEPGAPEPAPERPVAIGVPLEDLTPADPFECHEPERHVIEGVLIQTDGNGVTLTGACSVIIRGSHIAAGGNGIDIREAGSVEIEGSVVEGAGNAVEMHGSARLSARGTRFRGRLQTEGAATYVDAGGNAWDE
jgi:hypothetical protein